MYAVGLLAASSLASATSDEIGVYLLQITASVKSRYKPGDSTKLPSVESMLTNSSKTFNGIMKETNLMKSALHANRANLEADMSKLKALYERELGLQQQEIKEIAASIAALSAEIKQTKMNNTILRKHSADVQDDNSLLRIKMKTLESKLQTAKAFVEKTLDYTDDSSSEDVAILNTPEPIFRPKPHPNELVALGSSDTVEAAIDYIVYGRHGNKQHESGNSAEEGAEVDTFDDVAEAPAFLQVGAAAGAKGKASYPDSWRYMLHARGSHNVSKVTGESAKKGHPQKQYVAAIRTSPETLTSESVKKGHPQKPNATAVQTSPETLLETLKYKMNQTAAEYQNSMEYMTALFEERYQVGLQRKSALKANKARKEAKLKSLESLNSKLTVAYAALDKTHKELQTRIKGLEVFLFRVSSAFDK